MYYRVNPYLGNSNPPRNLKSDGSSQIELTARNCSNSFFFEKTAQFIEINDSNALLLCLLLEFVGIFTTNYKWKTSNSNYLCNSKEGHGPWVMAKIKYIYMYVFICGQYPKPRVQTRVETRNCLENCIYTPVEIHNYKLIKYICIVNRRNFKEHTILIVSWTFVWIQKRSSCLI